MESNSLLKTTVKKSSTSTSTLKRYSHLHICMILLVITVLTDHITNVYAQSQVDTIPREAVLIEGESASLLCRSGLPVNYCRIKIPGEAVLNLSPEWDTTPGFAYYGDGLQAGQCGVTIQRVSARNHGQVECYLGTRGVEATGKISLIVALAPNRPEIEILTPARGNAFEMDQPFRARCVVRDGRPAANITWYINDEPIFEGLGRREEISSLDNKNTTLITTVQEIQRILTAKDNGRTLICRASHIADRERPKESGLQLFVRYRPQPLPDIKVYGLQLGSTAIINVTIEANPRPRIDWTVDGVVIPQGTQNGRYEAYEPIDLGNGLYNVTFSVAGLTLEDTNKDYYLRASNEYGPQDYIVKISSSNIPASNGLDVGAIVGIVFAVVIILIAVLLIIFARATGRWCFAAKSSKTTTSETLDDVQVGVNSALLRNPDNSNVLINSSLANSKRKSRSNGDASTTINRKGSADHILTNRNDSVYNPTTIPINDSSQNSKGNQRKVNYSSIETQHQHQQQQQPQYNQSPSSGIAPLSSSSDINAGNSLQPFQDGYGNGDGINNSSSNKSNNNNNNNNKSSRSISGNGGNIENQNQNPTTTVTATTTKTNDSSENVRDLLTHGNELGIPESRCSKWIPKDQRELLEKQAKLLVNREGKSTVIY